ncbi:MAG TPA: arylsulfatase [Planctomycetota bacterium]
MGCQSAPTAAPSRPNIVVILADDMGYSDIGCYGGEIKTPNLDALAAGGLRFSRFYNTARCCPTRASLLSGLYPHQAGVGHMMEDRGFDGYRGDLNDRCVTIADVLRGGGYRTYMAGKWHLTKKLRPADRSNWPLRRGFDRFYGTIHGGGSFYDPTTLTRDDTPISPYADPEYKPETYYYTDAVHDHAARFIREHEGTSPFFLYVAPTSPHWPMHALAEDVARYRGRYDAGWDRLREERHARQIEMGLVKKEWGLTARDADAPAWADVEDKDWNLRCMEVYAAMVDRMDQGIGRVVKALRETGKLESTLILFLSDNGGCAETMGRGGPAKDVAAHPKTLEPAALQPDMIPKATRDGRPVRQGQGVAPGGPDSFLAYGPGWANLSNTPFRLFKHWVHEGGISTPLIAHWPAGIARKGEIEHQPGHLIDVMATAVELGRATYPAGRPPPEGTSLRPAFEGKALGRTSPLFWEHEGNRAALDGRWKLVAKGPQGPWELYDVELDRCERRDLAGEKPERVKELAALWDTWALRCGARPWPWK